MMFLKSFFLLFTIQAVYSLSESDATKVINKSKSVVRGTNLATMVRLTFHDCVGGCDGCVNIDNDSNNGLADLIDDLEVVYQENDFEDVISRADMWAILGMYAVQKTIDNNNENCSDCEEVPDLEVVYTTGRNDCSTSPHTSDVGNFPSATMNYDEIMDYFANEFDLNPLEVTALMGAHTLGQAKIFNSGYNGPWVSGETSMFNNKYYSNMMRDNGVTWRLTQRDCTALPVDTDLCADDQTTAWQYISGGVGFNLPADVALYQNFTVDSDGQPSCTFDECDLSETSSYVEDFANSNEYFVEEFGKVYTKVLSKGYDNLQTLTS